MSFDARNTKIPFQCGITSVKSVSGMQKENDEWMDGMENGERDDR